MRQIFLPIFAFISIIIFWGSTYKSSSNYYPIQYKAVAQGDFAPNKQKQLILSYNKYFNEGFFSKDFIKQNSLDTIKYKKTMLIEILLGEVPNKGYEIKIDKILENKDSIKVHFLVNKPKDIISSAPTRPYLIVQIPKSKKKPVFIENGEEVIMLPNKIYIDK